ncbi:glycosyl transferase family 1 [Bacteroidia bacterium]|nr:glycosyl transferase family 1 [Bacteroidia bacterium]
MNIGFDAKRAFCNTRGLGNYSRDTIRIMSHLASDHRYFLFTPKQSLTFDYNSDNTQLIKPQTYFDKTFPALWRTVGQTADIRQQNLTVFHGLSHELPVGIEKTNTKSVVTMHDLIFLKYPQLFPWIDRQTYKRKYQRSCRVANHIIAASYQTKADLVNLWNIDEQRITVVYQGCNPMYHQTCSPDAILKIKQTYHLPQNYILNVGAIERRKNQELIIRALALSNRAIPLVIVGNATDYINTLQRLIQELNLQSSVIFLTNVVTSDLPALYQGADLFVYPSLFEGFGIPILEALSSRVPVIASSGSCLSEVGGQQSLYVNPHDVEALANAMVSVLDDERLRQQMINEGTKHTAHFSDAHIVQQLLSVYQSVL